MAENHAVSTDPHTPSAHIATLDATSVATALTQRDTTSVEVVTALLDRIAAIDTADTVIGLRSVLAVDAGALAVAHERDAQRAEGHIHGPLHGVPVLIKDNIEAVGLPGTAGATSLVGRAVTQDSPIVERLRNAGAIILGATNLSEWANIRSPHSSSGWSAVGGLTGNPWALDRSAGGSSSGSGAAVAAGLAPCAVGTETDGSIVCPSSLNGLVGIKPTVGAVPTNGVVPISHSQDSPGPMARTVRDAAMMLEVLSGVSGLSHAAGDTTSEIRIGVMKNYRSGHPATDELFDTVVQALAGAGIVVGDSAAVAPDAAVGGDELTVLLCELRDGLNAYLPTRTGDGPRSIADVIAHEQAYAATELTHFGHEFFIQSAASEGCASDDYRNARRRNLDWAVTQCLEPGIDGWDVLIAPSYAPAWKIDLVNGDQGLASPVTRPAAISGWPIACVPMGLVEGLPVGLAVIARPNAEATLVRAAAQIERRIALPDAQRRPSFRAAQRG
ncbi:MAG: amidase [Actinobacteria bacterium]|nr:amidase [Actinomycetota bacterium]